MLRENLTGEQKKTIIHGLPNFVEKYDQDGNHIKDKVRVIVNGSQQVSDLTGETYGAVCRFESLMSILGVAVVQNQVLFRLDVVAAFLKPPMNSDVKHKWVYLARDISLLGFLYRSADSRGSFLPTRASGLPLDLQAV